jgi:Phosphotransferase enzyme family
MQSTAEPVIAFDAVLERLRADGLLHFDGAEVTMDRGRVFVRQFSQIQEVRIDAGGRAITAFVKILKPRAEGSAELEATRRNIAREFDMMARVHRGLQGELGLSTARPIVCYPDLLAMVTERVDGVVLDRLLARGHSLASERALERLSATMRSVGAWLKAFQTIDAPGGQVSLDQMRIYFDKRLQPLAEGGVISREVRGGLLKSFDTLAGKVSGSDLVEVLVHADFTPENVVIRDREVAVLDFTMAKRGLQYLDLSHMFMHVNQLKARPWFRPAVVDALTKALVEGFDPHLREDHPLFQLLLLVHVTCHLRQAQLDPPGLPARVYSEFLRRQDLKWLRARAASS